MSTYQSPINSGFSFQFRPPPAATPRPANYTFSNPFDYLRGNGQIGNTQTSTSPYTPTSDPNSFVPPSHPQPMQQNSNYNQLENIKQQALGIQAQLNNLGSQNQGYTQNSYQNSTQGNPGNQGANPTGYSVNVPNQTNSNVIGSGLGYADVLNARNNLMNDYKKAQDQYAKDYQNITTQTIKGQHAGDTVDYGTGMANLIKEESTPVLAADQMRAQNALGALGANQQTAQLVNPFNNQVSPGSTAVNPITNQPAFSGMGAAPQTIASIAQQMAQTDQQYGSMITNQDGSPNYQAYYQRAQSFLQGQNPGGSSVSQGGFQGQSGVNQNGGGGDFSGGQTNQSFAQSLPPAVYPSYQQTSTGQSYFDSSKLDQTGIGAARQISKTTGIPIIDAQDASAVKTTDQAIKNLKLLQANFNQLATSDGKTALMTNLSDPFSTFFQTPYGSALSTYNNNRDGLLQQIRALAGSSPRINSQELNLAINALPTLSEFHKDTIQTGAKKINTVLGYLNNALGTLIPGQNGISRPGSGSTLNGSQQGSGSSIQRNPNGTLRSVSF